MPLPLPTFPVLATRLVSEFRGDFNDMLNAVLSAFTGPDEPSQKFAGMLWVDTSATPKLLKQRNTANTAWVVRARIDVDYGGVLPIAGGIMEGGINMGGFGITNLPVGSGNAPARYSDLAPYARLDAASPFTAVPSGPATDPSLANQLARKAYVDARAVAGGNFTGQINLPSAAGAASIQAVRQVELENLIGTHTHSGAPGQGSPIGAVGIQGNGVVGDQLRSTGSGVAFVEPARILSNPSFTIVNTGAASGGFQTADLSGAVPVPPGTARVAILFCELKSTKFGKVHLKLKRFIDPVGEFAMYYIEPGPAISGGPTLVSRFQLFVELDSTGKKFSWSTDFIGTDGSGVNCLLVYMGYI